MKIYLHQTHHNVADFESIFSYLKDQFSSQKEKRPGIHIFPELFLTGYPLQDLCLNSSFIASYLEFQDKINIWAQEELSQNYGTDEVCLLMGGLNYHFCASDVPLKDEVVDHIKNVIFQLVPGQKLNAIYTKQLLPNYDIFDEQKYYKAGTQSQILDWNGISLGLLICEDMWASNVHAIDPCLDLYNYAVTEKKELHALINLSGSPYNLFKREQRVSRAKELSELFQVPFIYVNRVGGEDEILFDGSSVVVAQKDILCTGKFFEADLLEFELDPQKKVLLTEAREKERAQKNTWEGLFSPLVTGIGEEAGLPRLKVIDRKLGQEIVRALSFGLQEYAQKSGFKKFLVALSGGMDSALVLAITRLSLQEGQELEAVYMPGMFSRSISFELSDQICKKLGVKLYSLPIKFLHTNCRNLFGQVFGEKMEGLCDENIQSRLRGALIYGRSNQTGAMVINTSNKSELAVGYSTQYGDSVGAISMLGDLYKTEVYQLANILNELYPGIIPEEIITRPASAELREDQKDEDSLPPYERLDVILECLLSYRYNRQDILKMGFSEEEVNRVINLYRRSEYKRAQFSPIIKIKSKSFGFGYRIPLSKNGKFY